MSGRYLSATLRIPDEATLHAYLAGLIDGEGSILKANQYKAWRVCISNNSPDLSRWLLEIGGRCDKKTRYSDKHADGYNWMVERGADVVLLLETVEPFLVVKRARARECLAELRDRMATNCRGRCEICGTPYRTMPSGKIYCPPCNSKRERQRRAG